MGMCGTQSSEDGAVKHLEKALELEDPTEKEFHVKQALQLLNVAHTDT